MRAAVTGASGFIGHHVLAELARLNIDTIAVTRDAKKLRQLPACIRAFEADIYQPAPDFFVAMGKPDVLIHLAWGGLPNYGSLHHFETELPRQYGFLRSLIGSGLPALVSAGTCFEYGLRPGALSEEILPQPVTPYGYAKDALRRQLDFLRSAKPCNISWARLFYMYGDGQPKTSIYSQLREAVLRGDAVFNMSAGEQLRDYLPVEEVARMLVRLAVSGRDSGAVNVCSGKPVSVRGIVERWLKQNNWKIELNLGHYAYPDHEPMAFWGDASKFKKIVGDE